MEYIYSAMLLHKAGQQVNEANVKKVLEAAGVKVNDARAKALVAALEGVNIDEAIEKAAVPVAPVAQAAEAKAESKVDEKKKAEEEKKGEEQAAGAFRLVFLFKNGQGT